MKKNALILLILLLPFLQNCINHTNTDQPANGTVVKKDTIIPKPDSILFSRVTIHAGKHPWNGKWNFCIADEIKKNKGVFIDRDTVYKTDILRLCPDYFKLQDNQKIAFWTLLIASMAKFESDFDTACRFKEPPPLNTYSEGLLQLSYGDETRFKNVPLDTKKQNILNPEVNLRTGVVILARQLEKKNVIFTQKHYYWSVLTNKQNEIISFFRDNAAELKTCL